MTVIPFEPGKKQEGGREKNTLLETCCTLEKQIEDLESLILAKEVKLQTLAPFRNNEIYRTYQKEIERLKREKVLLEKTRLIVMNELMQKKEESE